MGRKKKGPGWSVLPLPSLLPLCVYIGDFSHPYHSLWRRRGNVCGRMLAGAESNTVFGKVCGKAGGTWNKRTEANFSFFHDSFLSRAVTVILSRQWPQLRQDQDVNQYLKKIIIISEKKNITLFYLKMPGMSAAKREMKPKQDFWFLLVWNITSQGGEHQDAVQTTVTSSLKNTRLRNMAEEGDFFFFLKVGEVLRFWNVWDTQWFILAETTRRKKEVNLAAANMFCGKPNMSWEQEKKIQGITKVSWVSLNNLLLLAL